MQNPSAVRAFFEMWSQAEVAPNVSASVIDRDAPPIAKPLNGFEVPRYSKSVAVQWKLDDFGVGLPPLAGC